jgi:anti-sigma B factor antagonist
VTADVQVVTHPDDTLPRVLVLSFGGELDYTNADRVRRRVAGLLTPEHRSLILDLSDLTFCDSTGIRAFLALRALINERGGVISLTDLHPRLSRVFQTTGLARFFSVRPTRADALAEARDRESGGPAPAVPASAPPPPAADD